MSIVMSSRKAQTTERIEEKEREGGKEEWRVGRRETEESADLAPWTKNTPQALNPGNGLWLKFWRSQSMYFKVK